MIRRRALMTQGKAVDYLPVGGKIFYIDDTASGANYKFYDNSKREITDIQIGDEPAYYSITGTPSKDKYYILHDSHSEENKWTYNDGEDHYADEGTSENFGSGKANTELILSKIYADYTDTMWFFVKSLRDDMTEDCNDWYIGSKAEIEALANAIDRDGHRLTPILAESDIWSSSEYGAEFAYYWNGASSESTYRSKGKKQTALAFRSF